MDNKKHIRNFQLITAIAPLLAVLAYFIGIFNFKFDFLLGEISGSFSKIMSQLNELAEHAGMNVNEILSQVFSQIDSEAASVLLITFIATLVIPFVLNLISAIFGFVTFAKKIESKNCYIISLIASIYTAIVAILFAVAMAFIKEEAPSMSDMISFGSGYYIQIIAVVVAIVFSILLIVKFNSKEKNPVISETDVGLVGVCGMWTNAEFFNNSGRPIVIGRNPSQCDVVITENAEKVSRKHCTVNFDYKNNMYIVTDHSSNGTHLDNGKRLVLELPTPVECGTVIIIGDENNAFRLN